MQDMLDSFQSGNQSLPGQESPPLFHFIPMSRIILDPLHAFLRIGDKLINSVIDEVGFLSFSSVSPILTCLPPPFTRF